MVARALNLVLGDVLLLLIMPALARAAAYSVSGRGEGVVEQVSWRK